MSVDIIRITHQILKAVPGLPYVVRTSRELRQKLLLGPLWPIERHRLIRHRTMSLSKFAATVLHSGDVCYDIGANIGVTALLMASCVAKTGRVCAFEPNPISFGKLEQAAKYAWYRNLIAHSLALSDKSGTLTLLTDLREFGYASTLVAAHATREAAWHKAEYSPTSVKATTLDTFCETSDHKPTFLKIDVEGAEEMVIRGGQKIIASHHPLIWFECWCGLENGVQINKNLEHFKQLTNLSYKFFLATIFKFNGEWIYENDHINPAQLLPFEPQMLEHFPVMGCDILAATNDHLDRLHKCGLISKEDAQSHILRFPHNL